MDSVTTSSSKRFFCGAPYRPPYLMPEQIDKAIRELKETVKNQQNQIDELIRLAKSKDS